MAVERQPPGRSRFTSRNRALLKGPTHPGRVILAKPRIPAGSRVRLVRTTAAPPPLHPHSILTMRTSLAETPHPVAIANGPRRMPVSLFFFNCMIFSQELKLSKH